MKNGFTLVELLGVIIIISLLALLTSVAVTKLVKDSKQQISNVQKELIKSSAEMWGADNLDKLPSGNSCKYLTLKDLKDYGLLSQDIVDSTNNGEISDDLKIKITSKIGENGNEILNYEVNPSDIKGCVWVNYVPYKDNSGANIPELLDGLTPVIYDEDKKSWVIADPSKEWYNYDEQWWANAVILKDTARDKEVGDELTLPTTNNDFNSSDVLAMFVWIPRYSYTIKGTYGDGGTSTTEPGAIDIKFVSKNTSETGSATYNDENDKKSSWYTHPAFTFGDKNLSGIWVGKFETSHTTYSSTTTNNQLNCTNELCENADELRILPNVQSLRYNTVSNMFFASRSMSRENNPFGVKSTLTDTHMMKNSEWGAVAYLTQSKYGKYGKDESEVYINNCSSYITGIGANSASESSSSTTCTYDENRYNGTKGVNASTTGNIYGIYDMSGGAYEYVMGYLTTALGSSLQWGSTSISNDAGFSAAPDLKYFDGYTGSSAATACSEGVCYGHALSETSGWYGDYAYFLSSGRPWFIRGGNNTYTGSAGVFDFYSYYGGSGSATSFRVVFAPTT